MNDLPPIRTAPAAQRNRRSQRWTQQPSAQAQTPAPTAQPPAEWQRFWPAEPQYPAAASPRQPRSVQGRRAARPGKQTIPPWAQIAVLSVLMVALGFAGRQWWDAEQEWRKADQEASDVRLQLEAQEQERLEWEEKVNSFPMKYVDLIRYYAALNDVDPAYVAAIIKQESGYDPGAVSNKNARGLMQFMPDTYEWVSKNCGYRNRDISILFEPEPSIKMGCYLLRYIINHLGSDDPILVACAYHAGWGSVNSWLKNYSTDGKTLTLSQIPKDDTRHYAKKVLENYAIYQQYYY